MTVDDQPIEVVKSAKLLGVIFNDDLKWNDHVDYIVKKSAKRLYMLTDSSNELVVTLKL